MRKKDIRNASTRNVIDWLCYHCWREYERACRKSEAAGKKILKEIGWMKDELEARAKKGGY
ncbi:MAG: hypothetical protein IJH79_03920 [Lentisphaeria bacterium]|jgi:hypothetical protein|nr:hypothetical protein [Lentisphaeria bacterium]